MKSGEYERVIVVGHSLGSVVAYDILKHLWQEYYTDYRQPKASTQPALAKLEKIGEDLRKGINGATVDNYMQAQIELWKEMRSLGNPWLVTDLITAGSPLTHAAMLLANDEDDLRARQRQRDLPTNPPEPEVEKTKKRNAVFTPTLFGKVMAKERYKTQGCSPRRSLCIHTLD